jgi:hypothetical protein
MQIIQGGKPDPEPVEDTFLEDILLTPEKLKSYLDHGLLTQDQYDKLIEEVPNSNN